MTFREATRADIAAMLEIYRPYVESTTVSFEYETPSLEEFSARFERITGSFPWLVAEEDGVIAGYAYADRAFERRAYAWDADLSVYIDRRFQGRGIGRRFYELLEEALFFMGYVHVYALVTEENASSRAFHEAMGYEKMCVMKDVGFKMGKWLDVIWYEKTLRTADHPGKAPKSWRKCAEALLVMEDAGAQDGHQK